MIKKERKIPLKIKKMEALLRRLPKSHPAHPKIESRLAKCKAGFRGEQSIDYYLRFLDTNTYTILHDLRLVDQLGRYFQIDTLLLSTNFMVILEIKNMVGSLLFDQDFHQLIRTYQSIEEGFLNPISQVKTQRQQLQTWLDQHKLPPIPIVTLIIISKPSTIIKATPNHRKEVANQVIHAHLLPEKMESYERLYKDPKMTVKDMNKISRLLLKNHIPQNSDILGNFQIDSREIVKGAHCPKCGWIPVTYGKKLWICPACPNSTRDGHQTALMDYALLLGTTITNTQAREFFSPLSISIVTKLLVDLHLPYSGATKARVYNLTTLVNREE